MKTNQKDRIQIPFSPHRMNLENFQIGGKYLIFEPIARGTHSVIYYGAEKETMKECALKFYNFRQIQDLQGFRPKQICKRISKHECLVMMECKCNNVLQYLDLYEDKDYKLIAFQYCQSSLAREIEQRSYKQISEIKAVHILKQICNALKTLHHRNRLHTRLQPKDILVKNGIYKLIDLGLPILDKNDKYLYYAPEILEKKYYDQKAQVWSIGVLFHQILYGEPPVFYKNNSPSALLQYHEKSIYDEYGIQVSRQASNFLKGCLMVKPEERLCWNQICSHPLFEKYDLATSKRKEQKIQQSSCRMSFILPLKGEQQIQEGQGTSQKFNIDAERMKLQKQIHNDYFKIGQPFQLQPLQFSSIQYLKAKINHEQQQLYFTMRQYYLQCHKVQFVYYYIIQPLMSIDEKQDRNLLQLLNLMVSSCFSAMSLVRFKRRDRSGYMGLLQACVEKQTSRLYRIVNTNWQQLSKLLFKKQNELFSKLSDRFKKFVNKQSLQQKDKFLGGIESKDFTSQEKFYFTQNFAKSEQIEILIQKHKGYRPNLKRATDYLNVYTKIWRIKTQDKVEENYPSLKQYIDKHILTPTEHNK